MMMKLNGAWEASRLATILDAASVSPDIQRWRAEMVTRLYNTAKRARLAANGKAVAK